MIVIDVIKDDYKFLYMWTLNGIDKNIYYINYNIFIIKNADLKKRKDTSFKAWRKWRKKCGISEEILLVNDICVISFQLDYSKDSLQPSFYNF